MPGRHVAPWHFSAAFEGPPFGRSFGANLTWRQSQELGKLDVRNLAAAVVRAATVSWLLVFQCR